MFAAILTACLISSPADCEHHEMLLTEWFPTMQMMEAQTKAGEWLQGHAGYEMRGLRVVRGRGV